MIRIFLLLLLLTSPVAAFTFGIEKKLDAEGVIVTRSELARNLSNGGTPQPASLRELALVSKSAAPYLILRFRAPTGGHIWGEVDAIIDGGRKVRQPFVIHFAKDWVEYYIPQDKCSWYPASENIPKVTFQWAWLREK